MKRTEDRIYFLSLAGRNKIGAVYKAFIPVAFYKDGVQVIYKIFLHFVVKLHGNASETVSDVFVVEDLVQVAVERTERSDNLLLRPEFLCLFLQFFFLFLKGLVVFIGLADNFEHVIQSERSIRGYIIRIGKITYELYRLVQGVPVRIDLHEGTEIIYGLKL